MLKFFSKRMNNKKGFTLIELIVVIAILAILALIAIPRLGGFRQQAEAKSNIATARTIASAVNMYYAETGDWPSNVSDLGEYLDDAENLDDDWSIDASKDPIEVTGPDVSGEGTKVWYPAPTD